MKPNVELDVDPRDCLYRPKVQSTRKQIEKLIKLKRSQWEPKVNHTSDGGGVVVNRFERTLKQLQTSESTREDNGDLFPPKMQLEFAEKLETILAKSDNEQKQSFTHENLVEIHRYMQYLDEKYRGQFFFEFLDQFRIVQYPKKRGNESLDQRIRRLKYEAANKEYESMMANISPGLIGKQKSKYSYTGDFRAIRSTLIATANALMVIGATFLFFYFAVGLIRTDISTENQVLISFIAAMIVAIAELYFLLRIV